MSNPSNPFEGATVIELLDAAASLIEATRQLATSAAGRNYSISLTAIEDAQMRYTRGRAIELGKFNPADLDR